MALPRLPRTPLLALLAGAALLLGGCHQVDERGETIVVTWSAGMRTGAVVLAITCAVGLALVWRRRRVWRRSFNLAAAATALVTLWLPTVLASRCTITAEGVHDVAWLGPVPMTTDLRFEDVRDVRVEERETRTGRNGRSRSTWWVLRLADGSTREVRLSILWRRCSDLVSARLAPHLDPASLRGPHAGSGPLVTSILSGERSYLLSGDENERMRAFTVLIGQMRSGDGSRLFGDAVRDGAALVGTWRRDMRDGRLVVGLTLELGADGAWRGVIDAEGRSYESRGTWTAGNGAFNFTHHGNLTSFLPEPA